jgi:ArsR family transcriptional regulator
MAMEDDDRPLKEECVLPPEVDEGLKEAGGRDGILSKLPTCESLKERAEVHQALSDPVRLRIVHLLGLSALCPCVLKDLTGLSDSKLSYHLSILEKAGLVAWRQNKNWRVYRSTDLLMTYLVQGYV